MNLSIDYQVIFSEIINGFSSVFHSFFGDIYFKHLSYLEMGKIDASYHFYLSSGHKGHIPVKLHNISVIVLFTLS